MMLKPIRAGALALAVAAGGLGLAGCEEALEQAVDNPAPGDEFDRAAMLANLGTAVIQPAYAEAASQTALFATAAADYEAALAATGPTAATDAAVALDRAREAWRQAMTAWQAAEMYQVGPAAPSASHAGGQDLRAEIYSWPTVNPCRIDQELVADNFGDAGFFGNQLVNVYGLDAAEYLLFYDGEANQCAPQVEINADGSWDALDSEELVRRRAGYAAVVAARAAADTAALVEAWDPAGGNFQADFADPGGTGTVYTSAQQALDQVLDALFYLEITVKDDKLATPLAEGAAQVESPWAEHSKANLQANVAAFEAIFTGAGGSGFDDFLKARGAGKLATEMAAGLDATAKALDAIPGTLQAALAADPDSVQAAYDALRRVTTPLKGEFATTLQLTIPQAGAGDSD